MRLIDADALWDELGILYHRNNGKVNWNDAILEIKNAPTIEERKTSIEFPHVFIAEGYDSIKSEDGETGFGIYDPENKQIFIAGAVPDEIFIKALLHELMHWVQDISGYAFNEDEANAFAESIYNTMEAYFVARRWTPCSEGVPENWEKVLITTKDGAIQFGFHHGKYWAYGAKAIAWMPLPEPYKEV